MRYRFGFVTVLLIVLALTLSLVSVHKAHAIPAFTRMYKTECSTCHTIYPELNEYGQAFLKNGYVYSENLKGEKGADKTSSGKGATGQPEAEKSDKNEGIRLSGIPELLPLTVTANQSIVYDEHD